MISVKSCFLLYLLGLTAVYVFAQEDTFSQPPEEEVYDPEFFNTIPREYVATELTTSPDASVVYYFPDSTDRKFVVSDPTPINVLVALHNEGERHFNVTGIQGSLVAVDNHKFYVQNFTRFIYNQVVPSQHQHSFLYRFLPDAGLDARDFGLVITVYYHDHTGGNYSTSFLNETIYLVDSPNSVNAQTFFTIVGVVGMIGFASVFAYRNATANNKKARARKIEVGTRTDVPVEANEWLAGTSAIKKTPVPAGSTSPRRTRNSNKP